MGQVILDGEIPEQLKHGDLRLRLLRLLLSTHLVNVILIFQITVISLQYLDFVRILSTSPQCFLKITQAVR